MAPLTSPQRLLRPTADHKFLEAVPETLAELEALTRPIAVLAIAGDQRTGKSFLVNNMHSRTCTDGFVVGHLLDAQTTGVWIRLRKHPRNPDMDVLIVDTEGLDTPHVPAGYNWLLSACTVLLADVLIYQSKGSIDAHQTERLDSILAIASRIKGLDGGTGGTAPSSAPSRLFMW